MKLDTKLIITIFILTLTQFINAEEYDALNSLHTGTLFIKVDGNQTKIIPTAVVREDIVHTPESKTMVDSLAECYSAIIKNDRKLALWYFKGNIPPRFGLDQRCDGELKILFVHSNSRKSTAIVRLSLKKDENSYVHILDTHVWEKDQNGQWSVRSVIYN